jgi:hypothetical protein
MRVRVIKDHILPWPSIGTNGLPFASQLQPLD